MSPSLTTNDDHGIGTVAYAAEPSRWSGRALRAARRQHRLGGEQATAAGMANMLRSGLWSSGSRGEMARNRLERIRECIRRRQYDMTAHAMKEMAEDFLDVNDVESAVLTG